MYAEKRNNLPAGYEHLGDKNCKEQNFQTREVASSFDKILFSPGSLCEAEDQQGIIEASPSAPVLTFDLIWECVNKSSFKCTRDKSELFQTAFARAMDTQDTLKTATIYVPKQDVGECKDKVYVCANVDQSYGATTDTTDGKDSYK